MGTFFESFIGYILGGPVDVVAVAVINSVFKYICRVGHGNHVITSDSIISFTHVAYT